MVYLLVKCYLATLRMASVNVNGAGGVAGEGFVTTTSLVPGVGMAAAGAPAGANVQPCLLLVAMGMVLLPMLVVLGHL